MHFYKNILTIPLLVATAKAAGIAQVYVDRSYTDSSAGCLNGEGKFVDWDSCATFDYDEYTLSYKGNYCTVSRSIVTCGPDVEKSESSWGVDPALQVFNPATAAPTFWLSKWDPVEGGTDIANNDQDGTYVTWLIMSYET